MNNQIHIENINEIGTFFVDTEGRQSIHVNLTKAEDLVKYVAYLYHIGENAEIVVDNINQQCFNRFMETIHSAALAKLKTLKESNQ